MSYSKPLFNARKQNDNDSYYGVLVVLVLVDVVIYLGGIPNNFQSVEKLVFRVPQLKI